MTARFHQAAVPVGTDETVTPGAPPRIFISWRMADELGINPGLGDDGDVLGSAAHPSRPRRSEAFLKFATRIVNAGLRRAGPQPRC